jgi:hypothetical protein
METFPGGMAGERTIVRRVGQCIYCGATEGLTDEHVVPEALRGNQVLAEAVCEPCRIETGRYESRFLQSIRHPRYALGMGKKRTGRNRKTRPEHAPVRVVRDGRIEELELPYSKHPNAVILPIFRRARIIEDPNGDGELRTDGDPVAIGYGAHPLDVARELGATSIQLSQAMPLEQFARTLAKIAYCETVRLFGLEALSAFVLPIVRFGADDVGRWVGTAARQGVKSENPNVWHTLQPTMLLRGPDAPIEVRCNVMLFANTEAPVYEVVVGALRPGTLVPASMVPVAPPG